ACENRIEDDPKLRRDWILLDLALAVVRGMLKDGVVFHGFNSLNDREFSQWLLDHGAAQESVDSALVRVLYCLAFAFPDGDPNVRAMAAGTGLHAVLRLLFGYGGAIMWKMQAGMGDTIFTPLYNVLKSRDVTFKLF